MARRPAPKRGAPKRSGAPKRGSGSSRGGGGRGASGRPTSASGSSGGQRGRGGAAARSSGASTGQSRGARGTGGGPPRGGARGLGGEQVEGRQAVRELLLTGRRKVREVWLAADLDPAPVLEDIVELAAENRVLLQEVGRGKLEANARTDAPQGVLAFAAPLPEVGLDDLLRRRSGKPAPFLLCCDGITDPGNLGALLRSAECAGVTGVVLPKHRAVHITPAVTKAAAGAIEHLPMAVVGGLPTAMRAMKDAGVWVLGLDGAADRSLWDMELADEPVALVLGAEGAGLSRLTRERCDQLVSIPLVGRLASLNVSTAGALGVYEVARHRARG